MANFNPTEMQKYLKGLEFPADKNDIIKCAKDNNAPGDVMSKLHAGIPDNTEYEGVDEIMQTVKERA